MASTRKIVMTAQDIRQGVPRNAASCPVAIALNRETGKACFATYFVLGIGEDQIMIPGAVKDFMMSFDHGGSVAPIEFEISL